MAGLNIFRARRHGKLSKPTTDFSDRRDVRVISVHDDVDVHVFWKSVGAGAGSACSVFALKNEIIKFDCFGQPDGHFHIALPVKMSKHIGKLHFIEQTPEEQINRAAFEISHNLAYFCQRSLYPEVVRLQLDMKKIAAHENEIREALLSALAAYRSEAVE